MNAPLVSLPELLQSIRHAGYLSPAHAVAELVDNSIQAGSHQVDVRVQATDVDGLTVSVTDQGRGMSAAELTQALCLGGSSRFDDRSGLGRFGMGLPCSSLSQARIVEVTSWTPTGGGWRAALNLDRVRQGQGELCASPSPPPAGSASSGTCVCWTSCDQLAGRTPRRLAKELSEGLGRIFRRFIWGGLRLNVNGAACPPIDPTLHDPRAPWSGAALFCAPAVVQIETSLGSGEVTARFTELPVAEWHDLSNAEKRARGITKGAGVSVLRAGREVDFAWLFMGDKRRESYDDWWRCELEVPPSLDEAMGLTFTKQQVRPCPELIEALTPVISPTAHALNARVRLAHRTLAARRRFSSTEARAGVVEGRMPPLPAPSSTKADVPPLLARLAAHQPDLLSEASQPEVRVVEEELGPAPLLDLIRWGQRLIVVINRAHTFYEQAYAPLAASIEPGAAERRAQLELLFVALARSEAADPTCGGPLRAHRERWSQSLAELVRG
jgi:hypothetical protein